MVRVKYEGVECSYDSLKEAWEEFCDEYRIPGPNKIGFETDDEEFYVAILINDQPMQIMCRNKAQFDKYSAMVEKWFKKVKSKNKKAA